MTDPDSSTGPETLDSPLEAPPAEPGPDATGPAEPGSTEPRSDAEDPPRPQPATRRAALGATAALGAGAVAGAIGVARLACTWAGARHGGPTAESWVYHPRWTIVQFAFALVSGAAAVVAVSAPDSRRTAPVVAAVMAAAVIGWSLNDGAYQVIASLYYLDN